MKKINKLTEGDDLLPHYDFSGGIRGKYTSRLAEENGYIKLDPRIIKFFKEPEQINSLSISIINSLPVRRKSVCSKG